MPRANHKVSSVRTGGMNNGASAAAKSRLPPASSAAAAKTGMQRGAGINVRSRIEEAPIRVPKKTYNLDNLGPDAYPDE